MNFTHHGSNRCVIATALLILAGCAPDSPIHVSIGPDVKLPEKSAVVFFADGLDHQRVDELLAVGELPNIRKHFVDGGVVVRHAISSMPSDTYPNTVSIMTGQFPGHHGILGNRWFDRYTLETQYYITAATFRDANNQFRARTVFEWLPEYFSIAIQSHTHRGATISIDNDIKMGVDWLSKSYSNYDRRTGRYISKVADIANRVKRWPGLSFYYFPGIDEIGHRFGTDSAEYLDAMRIVDMQVGRVADALEEIGLLAKTYMVLVSDHGHVRYDHGQFLDVAGWLKRRWGMRVRERMVDSNEFVERHAVMDHYDAMVMNGAFRRSAIYLRGKSDWREPPDRDFLRRILTESPDGRAHAGQAETMGEPLMVDQRIELGAFSERDNAVRIIGRAGSAVVERSVENGRKRYRVVGEQGDPLGYRSRPDLAGFVDAGWHASREWLDATSAERIPDFVPQVIEMFDSHRAGDLVLFASDHGTFYNTEESGHGSCLARDMNVVLFFRGPDLPHGTTVSAARNVDLAPTLLTLLGHSDRINDDASMDGVSIAGELRGANVAAPR